MSDLLQRLAAVLADSVTIVEENDGALTVAHDGTVASLRVVNIGEGLDLISLTQPLAWDIKLDNKVRDRVADHAGRTMLGFDTIGGRQVTTFDGIPIRAVDALNVDEARVTN